MRIWNLALVALLSLLPGTAPALSLQYDLLSNNSWLDFPTDGSLVALSPGTYSNVRIRIDQGPGDSVSAYVLNLQGSGGFAALPFADLFDDDGDGTADMPVDVTCRVRATADSNCGVAFLGPLPLPHPSNTTAFGAAETFASNVSFDIVAFLRLDLDAGSLGSTLLFAPGSSVVLGDFSELAVAGFGFAVVPEPGVGLLLGAGLAGLALSALPAAGRGAGRGCARR